MCARSAKRWRSFLTVPLRKTRLQTRLQTVSQRNALPQPTGPGVTDAGGKIGRDFAPERQQESVSLFGALALAAVFHTANACLFGLNRFLWAWLAAFPALIWLLAGCAGRREAFWLGWVFAFGYFLIGLYWINNAFLVYAGQYWFMVPLIGVGFPAFLGLFGGAATVVTRVFNGSLASALSLR